MMIEDFFSILFHGIYTEKVLKDWDRPAKNNVGFSIVLGNREELDFLQINGGEGGGGRVAI